MIPTAWKRRLGEKAYNQLIAAAQGATEEQVCAVLDSLGESGTVFPTAFPVYAADGHTAMLPDGHRAMTPAGIAQWYAHRGQSFLILRIPQLMRAVSGGLVARLQEVLDTYADQCRSEGVPLTVIDDVRVGGDALLAPEQVGAALAAASAEVPAREASNTYVANP